MVRWTPTTTITTTPQPMDKLDAAAMATANGPADDSFALVQQRLERNGRLSPRNTRRPSLLQGILVCRECGYAYYRCSTRSKNGILREYYRCSGTDGHRRPRGTCLREPARPPHGD